MPSFRFELYVAGDAPRSRLAIRALTDLCEEHLPGRYELSVIDVTEHPELAERAHVLATPTLLRLSPTPRVRIIGDLRLTAKVLAGLGLDGATANDDGEVP